MKKIIIIAVSLFITQIMQAQGELYLDNVGQPSAGSEAVGSDSWFPAFFYTGGNASGYMLDSIQLGMADATGNPAGFTVMIYTAATGPYPTPGNSLGTLDGSANPSTAGIYTYAPDTDLILSPYTSYYIVLTAGTAVANGAYEWSYAGAYSYSPNGGWGITATPLISSNGSTWNPYNAGQPLQYAITATAIPEPSPSLLLLLGSGVFMYVRHTFHR
jgi:hypothetical protein